MYLYWEHHQCGIILNYPSSLELFRSQNSRPTTGRFLNLRLEILRRDCFLFNSQPKFKMKMGEFSSVGWFSSCSLTEGSWIHKERPHLYCVAAPGFVSRYHIARNEIVSFMFFLCFSSALGSYLYNSGPLSRRAQHMQENNFWTWSGTLSTIRRLLINSVSRGRREPSKPPPSILLANFPSFYFTLPTLFYNKQMYLQFH